MVKVHPFNAMGNELRPGEPLSPSEGDGTGQLSRESRKAP